MKSFVAVLCLCIVYTSANPFVARHEKPTPVRSSGRIIGGDQAKENQFPWQVAVYYDTPDGSYFCGGALIAENWVLTAGHCVYQATVFTLHLGANSLVDVDENRVTVGVSHSVLHPDYDPVTLQNDIGLIRIDVPYQTNDHIKIIPTATTELESGVSVVVSGWGASGDWDGVENELQFVTLSTISNEDCQGVFGNDTIVDGMVCCVGKNNESTCSGDSGSPLVREDDLGNAVHVGVVSFISTQGCQAGHPSGYTRTATYSEWIESVIS